jgi:hydrogenase expression/formation protein HypC
MCLAIPGKVISIGTENDLRIGRVQFGGVTQPVSLDFVPDVVAGDYVMVHVGFAISRVDTEEAEQTYRALEQMGMLEGELPPGGEAEETEERYEILG